MFPKEFKLVKYIGTAVTKLLFLTCKSVELDIYIPILVAFESSNANIELCTTSIREEIIYKA